MRTPFWLRRLRGWLASHDPMVKFTAWRSAEDAAWKPTGVVVKFEHYDQDKAVAGYAKSRRQTETGRPYQLVRKAGVVIDMKRRQQ